MTTQSIISVLNRHNVWLRVLASVAVFVLAGVANVALDLDDIPKSDAFIGILAIIYIPELIGYIVKGK